MNIDVKHVMIEALLHSYKGNVRGVRKARHLLTELMDVSTPELRFVTLPIAAYIVCHKNWQITAQEIIDYCVPRLVVLEQLKSFPVDGDFDPVCEYMVGMADNLIHRMSVSKVS